MSCVVTEAVDAVERDGYAGLPRAFSPDWSARLFDDLMSWGEFVKSYEGGTVSRGPDRVYYSVPPEVLRGFCDIVTHPLFTGTCDAILGPGWQIIEVGCDLPGPGARNQPWHRDYHGKWDRSCLAFNVPGLRVPRVTDGMGPFQLAPGTHLLDGADYRYGMFPPEDVYGWLAENSSRRFPSAGDMSVRSPLALHRGTAADPALRDRPEMRRPVLVVGVVAAGIETSHRIYMTEQHRDALPDEVRSRVLVTDPCEELPRIIELHDIEGLMMGG